MDENWLKTFPPPNIETDPHFVTEYSGVIEFPTVQPNFNLLTL
jgi:hypothetical protein